MTLRPLSWVTARPIAHRGLHDKAIGIIENSPSAFGRAITHGYAIECDVQLSSDGEAMVFHDDELDRLTGSEGPVINHSALELQKLRLQNSADSMQRLDELCTQVNGQVPLIVEIKSHWNSDERLVKRCLEVALRYNGPICFMSFDPHIVETLRQHSASTIRGIVAETNSDDYYEQHGLSITQRLELKTLQHWDRTAPHFISFDHEALPYAPVQARRNSGVPVITWTIRSPEQAETTLLHCDQITFEGFYP